MNFLECYKIHQVQACQEICQVEEIGKGKGKGVMRAGEFTIRAAESF